MRRTGHAAWVRRCGLAVVALLVAAWVTSEVRFTVFRWRADPVTFRLISINAGCLRVGAYPWNNRQPPPLGLMMVPTLRNYGRDWWPYGHWRSWSSASLALPLWLPLVVVGVPTGWLCWRARRERPGCCAHCGYDLTGNMSGRCSECGASTEPAR